MPYTFVGLPAATHLWLLSNLLFLFLTALIVVRLLRFRLVSWQAALVLIALACFTPTLQCLVDGQITIFLLLLWAAGMLLYQRQNDLGAGALFALATAIKLTPAILFLPLLLWKKWGAVTSFLATSSLLVAVSLWTNTPQTLRTYFVRVMPAMSGSIPYYTNYSLSAATQRLLTLVHTGTVAAFPASMSAHTVLAGRVVSSGAALLVFAAIAWTARQSTRKDQVLVFALLGLIAPVLSPVSWFHAYSTAFLAFALLWSECFDRLQSTPYLALLTAVTLLLGSAVSENLAPALLVSGHVALSALLQFAQLAAALGLVLWRIARMRNRAHPRSTTLPSPAATVPA